MAKTTPEPIAMKVASEVERMALRNVLKSAKGGVEWNECKCGWFYTGNACPDKKCPHRENKIRIKLYANVDDEGEIETGEELGLEGEALREFTHWGYEIEFNAEVDLDTGRVKLLTCDGKRLVD